VTYSARRVLGDCELALKFLEQAKTDQIWRVHWFAAVVLIRTVGDVLKNIDGANPIVRAPVKAAYETWKNDRLEHSIFWDFIRDQRNKLVKEYDSDAHPSDTVSLLVQMNLVSTSDGRPQAHGEVFGLDENIYRPMLAGPWEGEDARDVLKEAIDWWKAELNKIDAASKPWPTPLVKTYSHAS
jgi:hypothetical protein